MRRSNGSGLVERIAAVAMIIATGAAVGGCGGPQWSQKSGKAFERAARNNRPVLTYYNTAVCKYSARMEREVFSDPEILERLDQFELLRRDYVVWKSEAKKLGIGGTPGFVVRRPSGTVMGAPAVGYMSAAEFRAFLAAALLQR